MVEELLKKLNFEHGKDARYYIEKLKTMGIKIKDNTIEVKASRYHLARYGKMSFNALYKLCVMHSIDKQEPIEEVQQQIADIYLVNLEDALKNENKKNGGCKNE